ncbi:hypothetical protein VTL71DRAFT_1428 [Oculimacula yallundae]|uniref:Uncharacterized protein n=1 Tax=Oculimacula yallundae TaxID=86028 RepID=A0ABR4CAU0_9HELO
MRRIRKSQISPPIVIDISPPASVTSKYSHDSEDQKYRYDAPTPPRLPLTPSKTLFLYSQQDHNQSLSDENENLKKRARKPVISFSPPTPTSTSSNTLSLDFDAHLHTLYHTGSGYTLVSTPSSQQENVLELREDMTHLTTQIGKLIHAIRAYSFLATQTKTQTLSDIKNLIYALPRPPQALLLRQTLGVLIDDIGNLHEEKRAVFTRSFEGVLVGDKDKPDIQEWETWAGREYVWDANTKEGKRGLEGLWVEFLSLEEDEMRDMARRLGKRCVLMRIFDLLSALRAGSEELLVLEERIGMRMKRDFEVILGNLRDCEGGTGVGESETGVIKGLGVSMGGNTSMQWRVLGIVEGKRRQKLEWKMEGVKKGRGKVSIALLGVVEGLAEGGE